MTKVNDAYENCTGCAVCLLNCPVWREKKDLTITPYGRFKSMQWDSATDEALADSSVGIESCKLCATCEVLCPIDTPITDVTLEERRRLNALKGKSSDSAVFAKGIVADKEIVLVVGKGEVEEALLDKAATLLGGEVSVIEADMKAFESALAVMDEEVVRAIFKDARDVVVVEGLLLRPLRAMLLVPERKIISLGERLLREPSKVRGLLLATDLYIIDARSYNLDHKRLVGFYNDLKKDTGLTMNFDLHRSAISTGRDNIERENEGDVLEAQARWIVEGHRFERIVVENPSDAELFRKVTEVPVISILELGSEPYECD